MDQILISNEQSKNAVTTRPSAPLQKNSDGRLLGLPIRRLLPFDL